ncbi:hypothetical protein [Dactylosporangium sp. NPDC049140]|uniref:hypothetical protein n=1 Tax=Dactylosporangium sp. NPDC049140 TaxID=3155647 RepID=UPI0033E5BDE1
MRRALDSAAQIVLCVLLAAVALIAATPLRLPPRAPASSVAPPGTRAMWLRPGAGAAAGTMAAAPVDEFQQRVVGDPGFADRLTRRIQATCGTAR